MILYTNLVILGSLLLNLFGQINCLDSSLIFQLSDDVQYVYNSAITNNGATMYVSCKLSNLSYVIRKYYIAGNQYYLQGTYASPSPNSRLYYDYIFYTDSLLISGSKINGYMGIWNLSSYSYLYQFPIKVITKKIKFVQNLQSIVYLNMTSNRVNWINASYFPTDFTINSLSFGSDDFQISNKYNFVIAYSQFTVFLQLTYLSTTLYSWGSLSSLYAGKRNGHFSNDQNKFYLTTISDDGNGVLYTYVEIYDFSQRVQFVQTYGYTETNSYAFIDPISQTNLIGQATDFIYLDSISKLMIPYTVPNSQTISSVTYDVSTNTMTQLLYLNDSQYTLLNNYTFVYSLSKTFFNIISDGKLFLFLFDQSCLSDQYYNVSSYACVNCPIGCTVCNVQRCLNCSTNYTLNATTLLCDSIVNTTNSTTTNTTNSTSTNTTDPTSTNTTNLTSTDGSNSTSTNTTDPTSTNTTNSTSTNTTDPTTSTNTTNSTSTNTTDPTSTNTTNSTSTNTTDPTSTNTTNLTSTDGSNSTSTNTTDPTSTNTTNSTSTNTTDPTSTNTTNSTSTNTNLTSTDGSNSTSTNTTDPTSTNTTNSTSTNTTDPTTSTNTTNSTSTDGSNSTSTNTTNSTFTNTTNSTFTNTTNLNITLNGTIIFSGQGDKSKQSFVQLKDIFFNNVLGMLNKVPGSRKVLRPIFSFFVNFDDLWLYYYHKRSYCNTTMEMFTSIQKFQNQKWQAVPSSQIISALKFNDYQVQNEFSYLNEMSQKIDNFIQIQENNGNFFLNTMDFNFSNLIMITFIYILLRFLHYFDKKSFISSFLSQYSFWIYLGIMIMEGNIQYFVYLIFKQMQMLVNKQFSHKILHLYSFIIFIFILIFSSTCYIFIFYSYKKSYSKQIFQNSKRNSLGLVYFVSTFCIKNACLGFVHSYFNHSYQLKAALLLLIEILMIFVYLSTVIKKNVESNAKQWITIVCALIRIFIVCFFYWNYKNNDGFQDLQDVQAALFSFYLSLGMFSLVYQLTTLFGEVLILAKTKCFDSPAIRKQNYITTFSFNRKNPIIKNSIHASKDFQNKPIKLRNFDKNKKKCKDMLLKKADFDSSQFLNKQQTNKKEISGQQILQNTQIENINYIQPSKKHFITVNKTNTTLQNLKYKTQLSRKEFKRTSPKMKYTLQRAQNNLTFVITKVKDKN